MVKKPAKKPLVKKVLDDQERGARVGLIEDLLSDVYTRRRQIYWMNFVRGIFFGFGSLLGGTVLIAILVWILSSIGAVVPFLSDFIQQILDTLSVRK